MLPWILALFIIVPIIEVLTFIEAGHLIGIPVTVALVFATGITGAFLVRMQGSHVIYSIKRNIEQGRLPGNDLIEGLFVLVGGALLLTPGFFTDIIVFSMLIPVTRRLYREYTKGYFKHRVKDYFVRIDMD